MPDAETIEVGVGLVTARELDVLANGQVREERVVLQEEADGALVHRSVDPARRVEPGFSADLDPAFPWTHEPGDRTQDRRLARAGRADQGDRPVDLQRQPEVEGPKRNQDLVEERGHESRSRRVRSRARLKTTSTALMATAASNGGAELGVDRERHGLRDPWRLPANMIVAPNSPMPRAIESARPASSPARASGRMTRANVRTCRRQACARGDQIGIDRLERGDRLADVERGGDESHGHDDGGLRERDRGAEEAASAEGGQQVDPATAGGRTSGSSKSVMASGRARKRRVASR